MSITSSLLEQIKKGREGNNEGLPMGLPKLEGVIDGILPSTYYLIASGTGNGKTSMVLYSFIYKPLMENINTENFKIIYLSLEMKAEELFLKLLSIYIWETYGKEISYKELLSRKKGYKLSDEDFKIVEECTPWLNRLEEVVTVYDKTLNADKMYAYLISELSKYGSFEETETRKIYVPNNPNRIILVVLDHILLLRKNKGRTKKEEIDLASNYLITLRNRCGVSPVVVMQTNRGATSMDRRKEGLSEFKLEDLKESGTPADDSNVVLAIFNPSREKLASYRGYKVAKGLEDTLRSIICLKNRFGQSDLAIPVSFYGKCGVWKELPKAEEINDYEPYLTIDGKYKDKNINEEINKKQEIKNDFKIIM